MTEVPVSPVSIDPIEVLIGTERFHEFQVRARAGRQFLANRTIWNVNSTAQGGGVAEMLRPMLAHARALGVDARWVVVDATPDFFTVTKRLHNRLHGHPGDGGLLDDRERRIYETTLEANARALIGRIGPRDIIICHDPQTAGLIPHLVHCAALVIWRSHIGHESPNELSLGAWNLLLPYLQLAHEWVFSRSAYIPPQLDPMKATVIAPSIDPLSTKNRLMDPDMVRSILVSTGILEGGNGHVDATFMRHNGSVGRVTRQAEILRAGPPLPADRRVVVQVSRWDALKDPIGVLEGFAQHLSNDSATLILAGPESAAVADDPEGARMLEQVRAAWHQLSRTAQRDVQIACLPMADLDENAAIVNALQRHAAVVVQKSLYEGFGLTVTEAMWKARPIVASAVGGIQDQIDTGVHGMLVPDPTDLNTYAHCVRCLLDDHSLAEELGENAHHRVTEHFLLNRHLGQYLDLFHRLLG